MSTQAAVIIESSSTRGALGIPLEMCSKHELKIAEENQILVREAVRIVSEHISSSQIEPILKKYPKQGLDARSTEEKLKSFISIAKREHRDLFLKIDQLAEKNAILLLVEPDSFLPALYEELKIIAKSRQTFEELLSNVTVCNDVVRRYRDVGADIFKRTFGKLSALGMSYCRFKFWIFRRLERGLSTDSKISRLLKIISSGSYHKVINTNIASELREIAKMIGQSVLTVCHCVGSQFIKLAKIILHSVEKVGRAELAFFQALGGALKKDS